MALEDVKLFEQDMYVLIVDFTSISIQQTIMRCYGSSMTWAFQPSPLR